VELRADTYPFSGAGQQVCGGVERSEAYLVGRVGPHLSHLGACSLWGHAPEWESSGS
jgi:hypothetical protein